MDPTIPQARNDNTQPSGNVAINTGTQNSFQFLKNPDATRQKIVEILANTANGCLSELGYYPGMTLRMQELEDLCAQQEKDIKRMKADQRRLLEDNYKLNTLAQTQATRLKDMGLTEIEKASRLGKLEEEVQRLTAQKRELVQGRKMQDAGGKEVELSFTELQIKHMDLLESYRLAYAEVQRLHNQVKSQAEELNSVKTVKISSQPHPPGRSTNQGVHPANMQPQTIQQGQQIRQQQPQTLQRSAPHPPQQPQYNNAQRSASQPMIMLPSHPQYNQIMASQLSQKQKQGAQQQRPPMLQTVSPSQLYFAQQGLPGPQQQQQQPSAFYMPQAGTTAASPIVVPPEIQQRQPQLANAGQIRSQNQQHLNAAMTQQMSQVSTFHTLAKHQK
ncbi:hypothetical protein BJ165DRAFT_103887 [Panaeolus papilionaceus]|nr:hypothetical protein BJ165DRAFT_103887 [Panaeolus papilionaceus]